MPDFGIINYGAFIAASLILVLTPGPDFLYVLGKSITGGVRIGIASALGVSGGLFVHTLLVAFGLSVILASSSTVFWIIKICGACYLVFMGIRTILSKDKLILAAQKNDVKNEVLGRAFGQGVLTNVMNPKIILFFLAFLPQFINPASVSGALPFLVLGFSYIVMSTIWTIIIAAGAGQFKRFLDARPRVSTVTNKVAGVLYIVLGLSILFTPIPE